MGHLHRLDMLEKRCQSNPMLRKNQRKLEEMAATQPGRLRDFLEGLPSNDPAEWMLETGVRRLLKEAAAAAASPVQYSSVASLGAPTPTPASAVAPREAVGTSRLRLDFCP